MVREVGEVWELEGTIVLVLGPGVWSRDYTRCLVLYSNPDEDPGFPEADVDDWVDSWFEECHMSNIRRLQ